MNKIFLTVALLVPHWSYAADWWSTVHFQGDTVYVSVCSNGAFSGSGNFDLMLTTRSGDIQTSRHVWVTSVVNHCSVVYSQVTSPDVVYANVNFDF